MTNKQTVQASYEWTLIAYESEGNLWLEWSTDAPFRAQQDQIHVYSGGWPKGDLSIPGAAWIWADQKNSPWNTGLIAGSDWYCARIAESAPNGPRVYVNKLVTK